MDFCIPASRGGAFLRISGFIHLPLLLFRTKQGANVVFLSLVAHFRQRVRQIGQFRDMIQAKINNSEDHMNLPESHDNTQVQPPIKKKTNDYRRCIHHKDGTTNSRHKYRGCYQRQAQSTIYNDRWELLLQSSGQGTSA